MMGKESIKEINVSVEDSSLFPGSRLETRPFYRGNGIYSIHDLETTCEGFMNYCHQQQIMKQRLKNFIVSGICWLPERIDNRPKKQPKIKFLGVGSKVKIKDGVFVETKTMFGMWRDESLMFTVIRREGRKYKYCDKIGICSVKKIKTGGKDE